MFVQRGCYFERGLVAAGNLELCRLVEGRWGRKVLFVTMRKRIDG